MVEFKERFLSCDGKGNTYRLYFIDDLWIVLEQRNARGTFMTGFLSTNEAIDYLYEAGCDIDKLRPPDPLGEAMGQEW